MLPTIEHLVEQELIRRAQETLSTLPIDHLEVMRRGETPITLLELADYKKYTLRKMSLSDLNISDRTFNKLKALGYNTVGDLEFVCRNTILSNKGVGKFVINDIADALRPLGIRL